MDVETLTPQPRNLPAATEPATSFLRVGEHDLRLFEGSRPLIAAMVDDIHAAESRVWLETYTILADAAGRAIAEALKERARSGLDVRLMYDAMGSCTTPAWLFNDLSAAGVQVHAYHPIREALWRLSVFRLLNRRDHRKLLVVDDRVAYFGGMNIVDQSGVTTVAEAKAHHLPASSGWRDIHVRLSGSKQPEIAQAFERVWRRARREPGFGPPPWPVSELLGSTDGSIFFFDSRPGLRGRGPARVLAPLLRAARSSVLISMAYFLPVGRVLRELYRAARRGVSVRVIIPGESDVRLVQWATRHVLGKLLRRGIDVYERRDQMLHSKAMVIDERWTVVGSCNLDPRSLRLNLEFLGVAHSQALAAAVTDICAADIRSSRRVTLADCGGRGWGQRLRDRLAWSIRGLL